MNADEANRPTILWIQNQPEHYFNRMIDDLNALGHAIYIPVFLGQGPQNNLDLPTPKSVDAIFLKRLPALNPSERHPRKLMHADWRADLAAINYAVVILGGYAWRAERQIFADCVRRNIPVYMYADSNLRSERAKARWKRALKRRALRRIIRDSAAILPVNRLGVAYWRYYGGPSRPGLRGGSAALRNKIHVCPYYADYQAIDAAAGRDRAEVFRQFNLDPQARLLFTAARLVPAKALHLMVDAFSRSGLADKGYIWAVAGTGPLENDLKRQAGQLLNKSIFFLGHVQPKDIAALMHQAELFVLPSIYEPHGIVVQEAMAAGTPVLASDVCGAAFDLIEYGATGWTFRSERSPDLPAKLVLATNDRDRLFSMRIACRRRFDRWLGATNPITVIDLLVNRDAAAWPDS